MPAEYVSRKYLMLMILVIIFGRDKRRREKETSAISRNFIFPSVQMQPYSQPEDRTGLLGGDGMEKMTLKMEPDGGQRQTLLAD